MRLCKVNLDVLLEEVVLYIIVRDMLFIYREQGELCSLTFCRPILLRYTF